MVGAARLAPEHPTARAAAPIYLADAPCGVCRCRKIPIGRFQKRFFGLLDEWLLSLDDAETVKSKLVVGIDTSPTKRPDPGKRSASYPDLIAWYRNRVEGWPSPENPPSRANDKDDALRRFGTGSVTDQVIKSVRSSCAPDHWTRPGNRPKNRKEAEARNQSA